MENHVGYVPLPMAVAGPALDSRRLCPGRIHRTSLHGGRHTIRVSESRVAGHGEGRRLPDGSPEARTQPQPRVLLAHDHRDRLVSGLDQRSRRFDPHGRGKYRLAMAGCCGSSPRRSSSGWCSISFTTPGMLPARTW